jgi:hypothetical protein
MDDRAEIDYLHRVEALARAVVELAAQEPWFGFGDEGRLAARPIERAINELATRLRFVHGQGDGCVDH